MTVSIERARLAKTKASTAVRKLAPVNGVGLTTNRGNYAIKINLKSPARTKLPNSIDGVEIIYEVVGSLTKQ